MLDFGQVAVVFEIKSSLLTEGAREAQRQRRRRSSPTMKPKFVARSARARRRRLSSWHRRARRLRRAESPTATTPARIFPVCVSDRAGGRGVSFSRRIRTRCSRRKCRRDRISSPSPMMSINELEEILPVRVRPVRSAGQELLDFRFNKLTGAFSVHQAIYDLLRAKGSPRSGNRERSARPLTRSGASLAAGTNRRRRHEQRLATGVRERDGTTGCAAAT